MQRLDIYDLRDAWAGVRSVAMVGNAASILQRQNGALIDALAGALEHALDHPPATASLRAQAQLFSVEKSADAYLELLLPTP